MAIGNLAPIGHLLEHQAYAEIQIPRLHQRFNMQIVAWVHACDILIGVADRLFRVLCPHLWRECPIESRPALSRIITFLHQEDLLWPLLHHPPASKSNTENA